MDNHAHVLLTGGRGRVATALHRELTNAKWAVDVCSRTAGTGEVALNDFLAGDGPLNVDAVIHCAWSTVPAVAQEHPQRIDEVDLPLLRDLIARLKRCPTPPLLVFMSTGAVYGMAPGRPNLEDDTPKPLGEYAKGKLRAEALVSDSGLSHSILRVSNLYSLPSNPKDRQGVIAHLVGTALSSGQFKQWGGNSVKDYLHNHDFAAALQQVIRHRLTGIVNVASGTATSLDDLVRLVQDKSGRTLQVEVMKAFEWDVADNRLDITRLRTETGWEPKVSIEEGVDKEIKRMQA